ncbi:MAG: hypothetical protein PHU71_05025 [Candidatus Gracilibacteria bacterium]|nr:hypothetical protein [Candidatus Gracilibacteria bacterium]
MSEKNISKEPDSKSSFWGDMLTNTLIFAMAFSFADAKHKNEWTSLVRELNQARANYAKTFNLDEDKIRTGFVFEQAEEKRNLERKACLMIDRDGDDCAETFLEADIQEGHLLKKVVLGLFDEKE